MKIECKHMFLKFKQNGSGWNCSFRGFLLNCFRAQSWKLSYIDLTNNCIESVINYIVAAPFRWLVLNFISKQKQTVLNAVTFYIYIKGAHMHIKRTILIKFTMLQKGMCITSSCVRWGMWNEHIHATYVAEQSLCKARG